MEKTKTKSPPLIHLHFQMAFSHMSTHMFPQHHPDHPIPCKAAKSSQCESIRETETDVVGKFLTLGAGSDFLKRKKGKKGYSQNKFSN